MLDFWTMFRVLVFDEYVDIDNIEHLAIIQIDMHSGIVNSEISLVSDRGAFLNEMRRNMDMYDLRSIYAFSMTEGEAKHINNWLREQSVGRYSNSYSPTSRMYDFTDELIRQTKAVNLEEVINNM